MSEQKTSIPLGGGDVLSAVFHEPAHPRAWVVTLHGMESNKEGSKPIELAKRLLPDGIGVVRFDFRGCGESSGEFAATNVATRLADARAVIGALAKRPGGSNLGLFGSSMGGYVALFLAVDPQVGDRVKATVGLASPANVDDLVPLALQMPSLQGFATEYQTGGFRNVPTGQSHVLLLHGDADETVPVAHAETIWQGLREPRNKIIFSGCDHRFSNPADLAAAMNEAASWFRRYLP